MIGMTTVMVDKDQAISFSVLECFGSLWRLMDAQWTEDVEHIKEDIKLQATLSHHLHTKNKCKAGSKG